MAQAESVRRHPHALLLIARLRGHIREGKNADGRNGAVSAGTVTTRCSSRSVWELCAWLYRRVATP